MSSHFRARHIPLRILRPAEPARLRLICGMLCLVLAGCSNWRAPPPADIGTIRERAVTQTVRGVGLSAAVLGSEDSRRMFGHDVNATGVQPVWVEVENNTSQFLWLLRTGSDPDYFSPLEVAWSFHAMLSSEANSRLDQHFHAMSFENPILPGTTVSGILFTNPHRQVKFLNVDILGEGQIFAFTLFPLVPEDVPDEPIAVKIKRLFETDAEDFQDADALRAMLEESPCCARSVDGSAPGDPVNVVIIGELPDIVAALVRRGFRTERRLMDTEQRLFGREPDAVARKAGQGGVPANWLRIWAAPFQYRGKPVFLGQAGRPLGGRFRSAETRPGLHPNVDEARDILIQDMLYSGGLAQLGFARGVGMAAAEQPRRSLDDTRYFTDGLRAVMFFVTRPRAISNVEILDWVPYSGRHNPLADEPHEDAGG